MTEDMLHTPPMKPGCENVNEYGLAAPLMEYGLHESLFSVRTSVFCNSNCIMNVIECRALIYTRSAPFVSVMFKREKLYKPCE
jgi:hypothetical protein